MNRGSPALNAMTWAASLVIVASLALLAPEAALPVMVVTGVAMLLVRQIIKRAAEMP